MIEIAKCPGYIMDQGDSLSCPIREQCLRYTFKSKYDDYNEWIVTPYNFVYQECFEFISNEIKNVKQKQN